MSAAESIVWLAENHKPIIRCKYNFSLEFLDLDQITEESFNQLNADQLLGLVDTLRAGARQARAFARAGFGVNGLFSWVVSYVAGKDIAGCYEIAAKFETMAEIATLKFFDWSPANEN